MQGTRGAELLCPAGGSAVAPCAARCVVRSGGGLWALVLTPAPPSLNFARPQFSPQHGGGRPGACYQHAARLACQVLSTEPARDKQTSAVVLRVPKNSPGSTIR